MGGGSMGLEGGILAARASASILWVKARCPVAACFNQAAGRLGASSCACGQAQSSKFYQTQTCINTIPMQVVEELLGALGAEPGLLVQVPAWHYADEEVEGRTSMPLAGALAKCYDLR